MQRLIEDVKRLLEEADPTIRVVDASELNQDPLPPSREPEDPGADSQPQAEGASTKLPTTD
jgi:hypothetical protein